jgi:predicted secreted protein
MDNWVTGTAVYVVIWWLVLFITLPFGVRAPTDEEMEPGQEPGAPVKPMMWRKAAYCSVISLVIWLIFYFIADAGLISFRPE